MWILTRFAMAAPIQVVLDVLVEQAEQMAKLVRHAAGVHVAAPGANARRVRRGPDRVGHATDITVTVADCLDDHQMRISRVGCRFRGARTRAQNGPASRTRQTGLRRCRSSGRLDGTAIDSPAQCLRQRSSLEP